MPDISASHTVPKKEPASPITWGPAAAIIVTITVYFLAQFFGAVVILATGKALGFTGRQLQDWLEQVGPQFFYIFVVQAATLGALWLFLHRRKAGFKTLGLIKPQWRDLGFALLGFAIYFPVLIATTVAVKAWFPSINLDQEQQIGFDNAHGLALAVVFVSLVILPPIAEEILARGFLFLGLRKKLPLIWAAILTSAIFASAHLQFGSGAPLLWTAAIDTFILSLVLVFLRVKTGRLWAPIGLHMLKNGLAFMVLFIFVK